MSYRAGLDGLGGLEQSAIKEQGRNNKTVSRSNKTCRSMELRTVVKLLRVMLLIERIDNCFYGLIVTGYIASMAVYTFAISSKERKQ